VYAEASFGSKHSDVFLKEPSKTRRRIVSQLKFDLSCVLGVRATPLTKPFEDATLPESTIDCAEKASRCDNAMEAAGIVESLPTDRQRTPPRWNMERRAAN
jgi:hypothetical protein